MGKSCGVSFKDLDGIVHAVEVEADTLHAGLMVERRIRLNW